MKRQDILIAAAIWAVIGALPGAFLLGIMALVVRDKGYTIDPLHLWSLIALLVIGAISTPLCNWLIGRQKVACACGWKGHRRDIPWASTGMSGVSYCPHCGTYGIINP